MNEKKEEKKPLKWTTAWAVYIKGDLFMSNNIGYKRHWARVLRTRAQAKAMYPTEKVIKVKIIPLETKSSTKES